MNKFRENLIAFSKLVSDRVFQLQIEANLLKGEASIAEDLVEETKNALIKERVDELNKKLSEANQWITDTLPAAAQHLLKLNFNKTIDNTKHLFVNEYDLKDDKAYRAASEKSRNLQRLNRNITYYNDILAVTAKLVSTLRDTNEDYKIVFRLERKRLNRNQAKPEMELISLTLPFDADITIVWKDTKDPDNPFKVNVPDEYVTEELASFLEEVNDAGISFKHFTISISYD